MKRLDALQRAGAFSLNFKTPFVFGSSVHPCGHVSGKPVRETAAHLYPEWGGMYFNIPLASLQRALIINKLGTRHGVPQGDQPEQSRNRETDRKEESNREREEKTGKIRRWYRGVSRRRMEIRKWRNQAQGGLWIERAEDVYMAWINKIVWT